MRLRLDMRRKADIERDRRIVRLEEQHRQKANAINGLFQRVNKLELTVYNAELLKQIEELTARLNAIERPSDGT